AGEDARLLGAQLLQDRLQQDRAAERVRVAHPLREDVRAAPPDGRPRPAQGAVGGMDLAEEREGVPREPLAQRAPEPGHDRRLARDAGGPLQDGPFAPGPVHARRAVGPGHFVAPRGPVALEVTVALRMTVALHRAISSRVDRSPLRTISPCMRTTGSAGFP